MKAANSIFDILLFFSIVIPYVIYSIAYKLPHVFKQFLNQDQLVSLSSVIKAVSMLLFGILCLNSGFNKSGLILAIPLIAIGQFLNYEVYHKLGKVAAYYGYELGLYNGPQIQGFPFTIGHAQYKGCLLSLIGMYCAFKPTFKLSMFTLIWCLMYFYILLVESTPCGRKE